MAFTHRPSSMIPASKRRELVSEGGRRMNHLPTDSVLRCRRWWGKLTFGDYSLFWAWWAVFFPVWSVTLGVSVCASPRDTYTVAMPPDGTASLACSMSSFVPSPLQPDGSTGRNSRHEVHARCPSAARAACRPVRDPAIRRGR